MFIYFFLSLVSVHLCYVYIYIYIYISRKNLLRKSKRSVCSYNGAFGASIAIENMSMLENIRNMAMTPAYVRSHVRRDSGRGGREESPRPGAFHLS